MKISKLLNRKSLSIIIIFILIPFNSLSEEEPVDIWNIDKQKLEDTSANDILIIEDDSSDQQITESDIYNMQSQKKNNSIKLEETLNANDIKIFGLFDPEDYDLEINMWSNSNGNELKSIFSEKSFLKLYFDIRILEEEKQFSDSEKSRLYTDSFSVYNIKDLADSLFLFENIVNQPFDYRGSLSYNVTRSKKGHGDKLVLPNFRRQK